MPGVSLPIPFDRWGSNPRFAPRTMPWWSEVLADTEYLEGEGVSLSIPQAIDHVVPSDIVVHKSEKQEPERLAYNGFLAYATTSLCGRGLIQYVA